MQTLKRLVKGAVRAAGYDLVSTKVQARVHADFDAFENQLVSEVQPFTMTNAERIVMLSRGVRHVINVGVPGAIVECGVWRGGSMMVVAKTLQRAGARDRRLYLFDTFEGMPEPSVHDRTVFGDAAMDKFEARRRAGAGSDWTRAGIDEVRSNMASTGYPAELVEYVAGKVEETLPARAPDRIALLRLDTNGYESTRHELEMLWPSVSPGGIVIFDDYGHWEGCRRAVDEYFARLDKPPFMFRTDYTERQVIKA
jgi:O-methyltransferase